MYFVLSKIIWALLSPPALILVLLLLGSFCLACTWRRAGRFFIGLGIILFVVFGLLPAGSDLLATLENSYQRPATLPPHIDGIVVLGGSFATDLSTHYNSPVPTANVQRVLEGLRLARLYPRAKLIFSGGEGLLSEQSHPESLDVAAFIKLYGLPAPKNIIYEEKCRNTLENMRYTRDLVKPRNGETWLLVTSAWHMKRSLAAAKLAGWNFMPWPTAYTTDGTISLWPRHFNVLENLYKTDTAFHEYTGILSYRLTQKPAASVTKP